MYDVAVVGVGPAGAATAGLLARQGYEVAIIDQKRSVGSPVQCAGIVSPRVIQQADARSAVLRELRGAVLWGPAGRTLSFSAEETRAVVVDRSRFDICIARSALDAGAEILLGKRVTEIVHGGGDWTIALSDGSELRSRLLVGADGPTSTVAERLGLGPQPRLMLGVNAEIWTRHDPDDVVEVFVGSDVAPGFFAWAIPSTDGVVRLGLGLSPGRGRPGEFISKLVKKYSQHHPVRGQLSWTAGSIPFGLRKRLCCRGALIVGDAAGMVKATSGGGLHMGLRGARMAAEALSRALEDGTDTLSGYQAEVDRTLRPELGTGMRIYRAFSRMDDRKITKLMELLKEPRVTELIVRYGDIDYPTKLWRVMLKEVPTFLRFSVPLLKAILSP